MARAYYIVPTMYLTLELVRRAVCTNPSTLRYSIDGQSVVLKLNIEAKGTADAMKQLESLGCKQMSHQEVLDICNGPGWEEEGVAGYSPDVNTLKKIYLRREDGVLRDEAELEQRLSVFPLASLQRVVDDAKRVVIKEPGGDIGEDKELLPVGEEFLGSDI
jgi:hypothetical protein